MEESDVKRRRGGTRFTIGGTIDGGNGDSSSGQGTSPESETPQSGGTWDDSPSSVRRVGRKPKASDIAAAKGAADLLIGTVETIAYARYRTPDARMTKTERDMAVTGLAKSAEVLPTEVVKQVSALSAPVMACMGFALYFLRLGEMEQRLRAERQSKTVADQAEEFLANQPVYPTPTVSENGTYAPPKSFLQNLQEGTP